MNFVGDTPENFAARPVRDNLRPDCNLPEDTRLWAALQHASGGIFDESTALSVDTVRIEG